MATRRASSGNVARDIDDEPITSSVERPKGFGTRHYQIVLLFFGMTVAFGLRVNISVGIVSMTDSSHNPVFEEYDWNESTTGLILSSFFWGYVLSQIHSGLAAKRWGAKTIHLLSIMGCSILTILLPITATLGWEWVCASRAIQGFFQGSVYPCTHTLLAAWVHPSERGFLATITYTGTQVGIVFMMAISGQLAASTMGWPSIYYFSGAFGLIWCGFWWWFGCSSPDKHNTITQTELDFLESSAGTSSQKQLPTPWKKIFTSVPFLALTIVHCAQNWGYYTLLTEIPSYMSHVLEFDIKKNALLSAVPYLVMGILSILFSRLSDFLMTRGYIRIGTGRKLFNSIGHWVPMVCLIGLGYITKENSTEAVVLLTFAVGFNSASYVGYLVNHMDLSPNFAGTLIGITNSIGNVMSIIAPLAVGFVVTTASDQSLWRIIFFLTAAIYLVGNLIFVIFGQGTIQPWNDEENTKLESNISTIELSPDDLQKNKQT